MKLTELQPDMVYMLTSHDSTAAATARGSSSVYFAATGNPVRIEQRPQFYRKHIAHVELLPLADTPVGAGSENYGTLKGPEWRRGLSIISRVCTVAEWPAYRAKAVAKAAEYADAQRVDYEAREARKQRLRAVSRTLGFAVDSYAYSSWSSTLLASSDYSLMIEVLEAQAATLTTA